MKYSDLFCDWLVEEGFTHCFFVPGGNIMHLLDSARTRFKCVPFIHEVSAGIATEYFNDQANGKDERAFTLVTAGPGLTNTVTAFAGAFLESRELLVVGGQAKSSELATGGVRQLGHQEVDGISIVKPLCKSTLQIRVPVSQEVVVSAIRSGSEPRKGPVFLEFCLDAQGAPIPKQHNTAGTRSQVYTKNSGKEINSEQLVQATQLISESSRPILFVGGGVDRKSAKDLVKVAEVLGLPIATTWNGADRISSTHPLYFGRPGNWGMRWSNVLIQQADLILAVGTRLSLWETGYNWQEFAPLAKIIQVDISGPELEKSQPQIAMGIHVDASDIVPNLGNELLRLHRSEVWRERWKEWRAFGREIKELLPLRDPENVTAEGYVDPYAFFASLVEHVKGNDVIIPCSSGGAFTVAMQTLELREGQKVTIDKGLASMGYGLAGAIGAALANQNQKTFLIEGDGGFAQNMQEIGTAVANNLDIKIFIFDNAGYGSIRTNQRNYFGGAYIGCDSETGLGLPDWEKLFEAFGVPVINLKPGNVFNEFAVQLLQSPGPSAFIVPIDPEQTYFPKISSSVSEDGSMISNPLHLMDPQLGRTLSDVAFKYLEVGIINE